MVGLMNQASVSEAGPCKLPLLDGDADGSAKVMSTEVELYNASGMSEIYRQDRSFLYDAIRTAWALLLRCYTGSDEIAFEYNHNETTMAPLLRMILDEEDSLSGCLEKAKDAKILAEQERGASAATAADAITAGKSKTVSNNVSTTVCVKCVSDPDFSRMLGAKTAGQTRQVSDSVLPPVCGILTMISGQCHPACRNCQ